MFKMIKYEFRKHITSIIILLIVYGLLEAVFLYGMIADNQNAVVISMALLIMLSVVSYVFILVLGISTYNNELKSKSGYLVYMTPISYYHIIGAKLLYTLFAGIGFAALIFLLLTVNYNMLANEYSLNDFTTVFNVMLRTLGTDYTLGTLLLLVLVQIISMLVNFFMIVTVAYLAISLSTTILQNSKAKGFLSFFLFIVIIAFVLYLEGLIPEIYDTSKYVLTVGQAAVNQIPIVIASLVVAVGSFIGSGTLLSKHISL